MTTWSGRGASTRIRLLALVALGTFIFSSFLLFGSRTPARVEVEQPIEAPSDKSSNTPPKNPLKEEENDPERLPPLYPELKVAELALPQHDEDLPFPDGKNTRFVRFGNQMWGVGLNNQLFEMYVRSDSIHAR